MLCALVPLLPVRQTTATILWPQGAVGNVTAPLVSGAPRALDVSIPCPVIATLPAAGGLVLSTLPARAPVDTTKNGMFVRANADVVVVAFRDSVAAVAPRPAIASGRCSTLHIWANISGVGADFVGIPGAAGTLPIEKKPQVAGLFTDLRVPPQSGLSARIDVDTRFVVSPTPLKTAVMVLGVVAVVSAIIALAVLDRYGGRRPRGRGRWLRAGVGPWLADGVVVGTLLL
ncbi:MAG: arabinosyltransferase domain-containing protein, partial [Mycolicibacterium sp.]|nr:arabinosyltransferase domain-containing protein [Mycolicibacterium sp.]